MGTKFCPNCREVVITRALPNYSQIEFRGIMVKRREIIHREEDDSCGNTWFTVELPEGILIGSGK